MLNKMRGVTLIELVVVVAIVALLATIAVPSYRQFVMRSHRAGNQVGPAEPRGRAGEILSAEQHVHGRASRRATGRTGPAGDDGERLLHDHDRRCRCRQFCGHGHRGRGSGRRHPLRHIHDRPGRCAHRDLERLLVAQPAGTSLGLAGSAGCLVLAGRHWAQFTRQREHDMFRPAIDFARVLPAPLLETRHDALYEQFRR